MSGHSPRSSERNRSKGKNQQDGRSIFHRAPQAEPEQLLQRNASELSAGRVKRSLRIHQRADFRIRGACGQSSLQQRSDSRRNSAKNLRQAAARQAAAKLVHGGNSRGSGDGLRLLKTER